MLQMKYKVIINFFLQLWFQMNNKKWALNNMLFDNKENCQL